MSRWGTLLLVLLLAGCTAPVTQPGEGPVASDVFRSTAMGDCQNEGSSQCSESTVAVDSRGRIFVANGFGTELAVSEDDGQTWRSLPGPAPPVAGATLRESDALVRVTRDDKVVFSALVADYGPPARKLLGLHIAVSSDGAQTWPVNRLISLDDAHMTLGADRQWTTDGPDGALYLAYSHFFSDPMVGPVVFNGQTVPVPALSGTVGNLMEVARSDDGGATWGPFVRISPLGEGTFAGGIVATAAGDLVVPTRSGPADRSTVALTLFRSKDRGETWTSETVVGAEPAAKGILGWPSFAAKPDGSEALAWVAQGRLLLATHASPDAPWSAPVTWQRAAETAGDTPALAGTPAGWAISYVATRGQDGARFGDFVLAQGDGNGPLEHTTLAAGVRITFRVANSDFATLASGPDGRLVVTVTLVDPSAAIDAYVVKPKA